MAINMYIYITTTLIVIAVFYNTTLLSNYFIFPFVLLLILFHSEPEVNPPSKLNENLNLSGGY